MNESEVKQLLIESITILDGMWGHHQDGSDLLVKNDSEQFNIIFNHVIKRLTKSLRLVTNETRDFKDLKKDEFFCPDCGLVKETGGPCKHCGELHHQMKIKEYVNSFYDAKV